MPMQGRAAARSTVAEEHWRLLAELDSLDLSDTCCKICHCDCYSSHSSCLDSDRRDCVETCEKIDSNPLTRRDDAYDEKPETSKRAILKLDRLSLPELVPTEASRSTSIGIKKRSTRKSKGTKRKNSHEITGSNSNLTKPSSTQATITVNTKSKSAKNTPTHSGRTSPTAASTSNNGAKSKQSPSVATKRSKSVSSLRSRTPSPLIAPVIRPAAKRAACYTRDCKILQELLSALNDDEDIDATATLQVSGKSAVKQSKLADSSSSVAPNHSHTLPRSADKSKSKRAAPDEGNSSLTSQKLCASMASLCLAPTVRAAYQQVPVHDKRILNRMAHKRSERAIAKENAWLARKYWENERYERELFKCAQMEEYKCAVRDKQFQDYLLTKARLNEIAQRDLSELRRLREALHQKEVNTKRRLDALRVERGIAACQRRCGELRRAEAVAVQQEEQQIDEKLRKQDICARLSERLQRAEQIRSNMLDSYLRRLRYDNYMEELTHEEHWREAQQLERQRQAQLEEQIQLKRDQSQRFIEARQRRQEAIANTAKISASLRELVRNSVTPEGGVAADGGDMGDAVSIANTASLSKVLLDRPFSKLSMQP